MSIKPAAANPFNLFSGYDIFISYTRRGSKAYANKLYQQLKSLDFECFIDRREVPAGDALDETLRGALANSKVLVLVGSDAAFDRPYVKLEFSAFAETRRPVIVINVGGALAKRGRLDEEPWSVIKERKLVWLLESGDALRKGLPSPEVYEGIQNAFTLKRRRVVRRRWVSAGLTALTALSLAVIAVGVYAAAQIKRQTELQATLDGEIVKAQALKAEYDASLERSKREIAAAQTEIQEINVSLSAARVELTDAQTQRAAAERKADEAAELERRARERAEVASEVEMGSRAALLAQQPGREVEALGLAAAAADSNFKRAARSSQVEAGLTSALMAVDFALPFELGGDGVTFTQISPGGNQLFVEREDPLTFKATWELYPTRGPAPQVTLRQDVSGRARSVSFSRDGRYLAVIDGYDNLDVWDSLRPQSPVHSRKRVVLAALDWPGTGLALIEREGSTEVGRTVSILDRQSGVMKEQFGAGVRDPRAIVFDREGRVLVQGTMPNSPLNRGAGFVIRDPKREGDTIETPQDLVGVADDGSLITVFKYSATTGTPKPTDGDEAYLLERNGGHVKRVLAGYKGVISSFSYSDRPNVVTLDGGNLKIADTTSRPNFMVLRAHGSEITAISFSPDGRLVATGDTHVTSSEATSIYIWDAGSGDLLKSIKTPRTPSLLTFSPDGARIAAYFSHASMVLVWSVSDGKPVGDGHGIHNRHELPPPHAITFLRGGRYVATAHYGAVLALWDASSSLPLGLAHLDAKSQGAKPFRKNLGFEPTLATSFAVFSVAGDTLVTASDEHSLGASATEDAAVHVWDLKKLNLSGEINLAKLLEKDVYEDPQLARPSASAASRVPGRLKAVTFGRQLELIFQAKEGALIVTGPTERAGGGWASCLTAAQPSASRQISGAPSS